MTENVFEKHDIKPDYIEKHKDKLLEIIKKVDALKNKYPTLLLDYVIRQFHEHTSYSDYDYVDIKYKFVDWLGFNEWGITVGEIDKRDWDDEFKFVEDNLKHFSKYTEKDIQDRIKMNERDYAFRMECGND